MPRRKKEELDAICKKYGVDRLWSWSRYNTYINSQYEYLLKYILHKPEDRTDCIYAVSGGMAHDIMEKFYTSQIKYEEMIDLFEDAWLTAGIAELKFDRNDETKNKNIANKYHYDLQHFFTHHDKIASKIDIERFILIKIADYMFQGYIDACFKDDDGNYVITDWKTSSIYRGAKTSKECGQLLLYAIGLNQLGIPFKKIKIAWNFLKYVSVDCEQANGKITTREIERFEIGSKLQSNVKMWLKKMGYEDQLMEYLDLLVQTNDIRCLPEDVQAKYKIKDCFVHVDITPELIDGLKHKLVSTLEEIKQKEQQYKVSKDDTLFWESEEAVKKQSYYFATLCAYSPKLHKPYKQYLDSLEANKNNNLFAGVGACSTTCEEDDMSWLNDL